MTGIKTAKARKQRDEAVELLRDGLKNVDAAWRAKVEKFVARFDPSRFEVLPKRAVYDPDRLALCEGCSTEKKDVQFTEGVRDYLCPACRTCVVDGEYAEERIEALIAASSLGSPEVVALRKSAPPDVVERIVARVEELSVARKGRR